MKKASYEDLVMCKYSYLVQDGDRIGMMIRLIPDEIGVQYPGDENITWVPLKDVWDLGEGMLDVRKDKDV